MIDVSYFESLELPHLPVQNSLPESGEIQDVIAHMQMVNIGLNNTNTKCNIPFNAQNISYTVICNMTVFMTLFTFVERYS